MKKKTHREVKSPTVSARYIADYMAASETSQRTIIRNCKYVSTARVVQHNEAKSAVSKYIWHPGEGVDGLMQKVHHLRTRMADDDFDRDLFDHNADYIERFLEAFSGTALPKADLLAPGKFQPIPLNGVKVTVEVRFRLRRLTKTNKLRCGIGTLRYSKGKPLSSKVAEWQSAFLFGYLGKVGFEEDAAPEHNLCVTLDAYSGECYGAPSDSVRRFKNMESACATIAERWPNIQPPPNAVL